MINKYCKIGTGSTCVIFALWAIFISLYFSPIDFMITVYSSSDDLLQTNYPELPKDEQEDLSYIDLISFKGSHISEIPSSWPDKVHNNCIEVMNTDCNGKLIKFVYFNERSQFSDIDNTDKKNLIQDMNQYTVCTVDTNCEIINIFYSKDANKKNSSQVQINNPNNISEVLIQECAQSQSFAVNCLNINTQITSGSKIIDAIQDFVNSSDE
jgi:hypothetical protein